MAESVVSVRGVLSGEVAKQLGVTRQTIGNWAKGEDGNPCPVLGVDEFGRKRFDVEAVRAWATKHRGFGGRGGAREGAGRKAEPSKLFVEAEALDELKKSPLTLENMQAKVASGTATPAEMKIVKDLLATIQTQREMDLEAGDLVKASEVKREWMRTLADLRRELDTLPSKLVQQLTVAMQLDPVGAGKVRETAAAEVARLIEQLGGDDGQGQA